ncbi:hypothetical protein BDV25DRAFT_110602 [Aspergillus avenaceus]|uniref:Coenzyme Q-binding protein COQ10 START domain-containing protein n=1 Tax=Aspergillus avenaceus TaxID=36643 RepID=A0A5N6TVY6_ASPAV|nr:hypothetical protein BDV25DRAFT_110602 [Aspergillus avenaceus]
MKSITLSRQLSRTIHRPQSRRLSILPQQTPTYTNTLNPTRKTLNPTIKQTQSKRPFNLSSLSSLLTNNNNNNNNNKNPEGRTLKASRTLPYAPNPLYKVISSVESYSQFLPFLTASTVTARDPETGYPVRAFLTVGYGPLSETFTSRVDCDRSRWIVEARSGAKFGVDSKDGQDVFPGAVEGIFEYLSTKWVLTPLGEDVTRVDLEIRFEFRSQLHAAMMGAVEGQMAGVMIEAFEKRIREVAER